MNKVRNSVKFGPKKGGLRTKFYFNRPKSLNSFFKLLMRAPLEFFFEKCLENQLNFYFWSAYLIGYLNVILP